MTITFTYTTSRGVEHEHEIPAVFDVCDRCEGYGTHLRESIGSHAYSAEEFAESFDDEEREQYFKRGGIYDVQCETCKGRCVVPVVNEEACERSPRLRRLLSLYFAMLDRKASWAAEERAERRMGY